MPKKKPTADARRAGILSPKPPSARHPGAGWCKLGAGLLGTQGAVAYLYPAFGEILAIADIIIPLIVALILVTAILLGGDQTCERVFRLLRWIVNRPEPPGPKLGGSGATSGRRGRNAGH